MYYYELCVAHLFAMATMGTLCMVNIVNKLQKREDKGHPLSHFYNIDHR